LERQNVKAIRILNTWFEVNAAGASEPKYLAGQVLPADDAGAQRQVELLNAEEIDVPDDAEKAAQAAEAARAAADKAAAKAEAATAGAGAAAQIAEAAAAAQAEAGATQ
jgi:uncharacterized protein YdeI (YjbR/CyaY-like superfamily)